MALLLSWEIIYILSFDEILDFFKKIAYNKNVRKSEFQKVARGDIMLAEIRGRSQITIPAEIVKKMGISEGDKFEIIEKDGGIFMCPVIVYPKEKLLKIAKVIKDSEEYLSEQESFDSVEGMFADMGIDVSDV